MDQLQTRLDALEQRTHMVERRLRWWRGLAAGLLGLAVLTWALPSGTAQEDAVTASEKEKKTLEQRVAALESLLKHVSREKNEIFITGANLHLVNGLGSTGCPLDEEGIWQRFAGKWATCDTGQKPCVIKARPPLILKSF